MKKNLAGLLFGTLFGVWLSWTTFTRYDTLFGAFVFEDFYLWFMFASALATSTLGIRLLRGSGVRTWIGGQPIGWKICPPSRDILLGSAVFGLGWGIAGACPGPAVVQIGQGYLSGLFTLSGILAGIVICDIRDERATKAAFAAGARDEPAGVDGPGPVSQKIPIS